MLLEETEHVSKQNTNSDSNVSEFKYLLKVFDYDTKSVMYYDAKLARVEMQKVSENQATEGAPISEDLEVIAPCDEDEENPFNTEFEDPSK